MQKIMKNMKPRRSFLLSLVLFAVMFTPIVSVLADSISGDNVIIESSETLEKTSFLSGKNVQVDGNINGTTFITGGNVEVNGMIDGDLFITAQSLTLNGAVEGSIFLTGQYMILNGEVKNNIYAVGQELKVESQTNGNIFMVGQNVRINEKAVIERDAFIGAGSVNHHGLVNGDFRSSSDSIAIGGTIAGDLNYSSRKQADYLNTSEIIGETTWRKIGTISARETKTLFSTIRIIRILWSISGAVIIWLFVQWVRPTFWSQLTDQIMLNPLKVTIFGGLGVVFIPIISILLMVTIIGIPLSLVLLSLYGISLSISKIIVSVYFSRFLQNRLNSSNMQTFWLFLLVLILLTSLRAIPIIGVILGFLTVAIGVGAIGFSFADRKPQV